MKVAKGRRKVELPQGTKDNGGGSGDNGGYDGTSEGIGYDDMGHREVGPMISDPPLGEGEPQEGKAYSVIVQGSLPFGEGGVNVRGMERCVGGCMSFRAAVGTEDLQGSSVDECYDDSQPLGKRCYGADSQETLPGSVELAIPKATTWADVDRMARQGGSRAPPWRVGQLRAATQQNPPCLGKYAPLYRCQATLRQWLKSVGCAESGRFEVTKGPPDGPKEHGLKRLGPVPHVQGPSQEGSLSLTLMSTTGEQMGHRHVRDRRWMDYDDREVLLRLCLVVWWRLVLWVLQSSGYPVTVSSQPLARERGDKGQKGTTHSVSRGIGERWMRDPLVSDGCYTSYSNCDLTGSHYPGDCRLSLSDGTCDHFDRPVGVRSPERARLVPADVPEVGEQDGHGISMATAPIPPSSSTPVIYEIGLGTAILDSASQDCPRNCTGNPVTSRGVPVTRVPGVRSADAVEMASRVTLLESWDGKGVQLSPLYRYGYVGQSPKSLGSLEGSCSISCSLGRRMVSHSGETSLTVGGSTGGSFDLIAVEEGRLRIYSTTKVDYAGTGLAPLPTGFGRHLGVSEGNPARSSRWEGSETLPFVPNWLCWSGSRYGEGQYSGYPSDLESGQVEGSWDLAAGLGFLLPSASSGGGAHIPELMVRSVRSFELDLGKRVSGEVKGVVEYFERSCDVEGVVMPANCTNVSLVLFPNLSNYVSSMSIKPVDDERGSDYQEKGSKSTYSKDRDTIVHEELFGDTFEGRSAPIRVLKPNSSIDSNDKAKKDKKVTTTSVDGMDSSSSSVTSYEGSARRRKGRKSDHGHTFRARYGDREGRSNIGSQPRVKRNKGGGKSETKSRRSKDYSSESSSTDSSKGGRRTQRGQRSRRGREGIRRSRKRSSDSSSRNHHSFTRRRRNNGSDGSPSGSSGESSSGGTGHSDASGRQRLTGGSTSRPRRSGRGRTEVCRGCGHRRCKKRSIILVKEFDTAEQVALRLKPSYRFRGGEDKRSGSAWLEEMEDKTEGHPYVVKYLWLKHHTEPHSWGRVTRGEYAPRNCQSEYGYYLRRVKKAFRKYYDTNEHLQKVQKRLENCVQGKDTVDQFVKQLDTLSTELYFLGAAPLEYSLKWRLYVGLNSDRLRDKVEDYLEDIGISYEKFKRKVVAKAAKVKQISKVTQFEGSRPSYGARDGRSDSRERYGSRERYSGSRFRNPSVHSVGTEGTESEAEFDSKMLMAMGRDAAQIKCSRCLKMGHSARNCKAEQPAELESRCLRCGSVNHKLDDCRVNLERAKCKLHCVTAVGSRDIWLIRVVQHRLLQEGTVHHPLRSLGSLNPTLLFTW